MTAKNASQRPWTPAEEARLRTLYGTLPASAIARELGRSKASIKNRVNKLGLTKGHNSGCFQPGQTPWNKGTTYQPGGRSVATRFQPGHRDGKAKMLHKPVGSERINKDGYLERKINDALPMQKRWRAVHLILWEAVNGPLPAGYAVTFRDGNKQNLEICNLELTSRAELMRRNTLHNYGPEIASLAQLRGCLTRQINRQKENQHGQ